MKKVLIVNGAGHYVLLEYTEAHAKEGLSFSEIEESEWREHQDHIESEQSWQDFFHKLKLEERSKAQNS